MVVHGVFLATVYGLNELSQAILRSQITLTEVLLRQAQDSSERNVVQLTPERSEERRALQFAIFEKIGG